MLRERGEGKTSRKRGSDRWTVRSASAVSEQRSQRGELSLCAVVSDSDGAVAVMGS